MDTVKRIPMTINGGAVGGSEHLGVINPATEQVWAEAPAATEAEVNNAFDGASAAQKSWAKDDAARQKALATIPDILRRNVDELAELLTLEAGKTIADSKLEIEITSKWFSYFADMDVTWREAIDSEVTGVRHPLGVVAAITPWNFPLALASWKLAPALRAGNAVVLKPSPYTPMATLRLGELLAEALPPGVFNVLTGGDDVGVAMTLHPATAKVSFTGSVAGGKAVNQQVAGELKRVTLELGGNDPAVVLGDADPLTTAQGLFWGGFYHNGQVCGAAKRVYVPESIYPAVAEEIARIADATVIGDTLDPSSQLGPVQNRSQFERVCGLLDDALSDGAHAKAGGVRVGERGYFLRPTILTEAHAGQAVVDEEQFGPVLPLISYKDLGDAIEQANDTTFGLGASVWGKNPGQLEEVALAIEAGTVWLNKHAVNNGPHVPFGGLKWSGLGIENGLEGFNSFTRMQMIYGKAAS